MTQPSLPPQSAPKKGLPVIAWIGIGCGAIVFVGVVGFVVLGMFAAKKARDFARDMEANPAKTAAETFVRFNPELELVSSDESAGTITIREKKTGKVATFKYSDLEKGRLVFESAEGRVEIGAEQGGGGMTVKSDQGEIRFGASASAKDVPSWVPLHPEATQIEGTFATKSAEGETGAVSFTVPGNPESVTSYYRSWMDDNDFEVTTGALGNAQMGILVGTDRGSGRTLNVACVPGDDGGTRVTIQYSSTGG